MTAERFETTDGRRGNSATAHANETSASMLARIPRSSTAVFLVTETISALLFIRACEQGDGGTMVSCGTAMLLIGAPAIIAAVFRVSMSAMLANTVTLNNITKVSVNGHDLGLGGYLDLGLRDTMKDLIVGGVGALVFALTIYLVLKTGRCRTFVSKFLLRRRSGGSE